MWHVDMRNDVVKVRLDVYEKSGKWSWIKIED